MHSFDFTQGSAGSVQGRPVDGQTKPYVMGLSTNALKVRPTRLRRLVWKNKRSLCVRVGGGSLPCVLAPSSETINTSGFRRMYDTNVVSVDINLTDVAENRLACYVGSFNYALLWSQE